MKKKIVWISFMFLVYSSRIWTETVDTTSEQKINYFTYRIVYRFYLISRLTPTIEMFFTFLNGSSHLHFYKESSPVTCLESIKKHWHDFCAYRYLLDPEFEPLFIKCIYILIQNFIVDIDILEQVSNKEISNSSLLEVISEIEQSMETLFKHKPHVSMPAHVTVDTITDTFYVMKRLEKSVSILQRVQEYDVPFVPSKTYRSTLHELESICVHPRITQVVHDILQKKSIKPLVKLCEEFQQYRYADDSPFLREMLSVLLMTYRDLLACNKTTKEEQTIMNDQIEQMLQMYQDVELLSTEEVLDCIDTVTDYLDNVVQDMTQRESWYNKLYHWIFG